MAMGILFPGLLCGQDLRLSGTTTPQPRIVTPSDPDQPQAPPSDALILLGGDDLSAWMHPNGASAQWDLAQGVMTVKPHTGNLQTRESFEDFQLHLEWSAPEEVRGEGQLRGNSGVLLQGRYEIQILDSYQNETYINGQAGSIYKQYPPLVNAMRPPGQWNTYDIIFTAPRFKDDGSLHSPACITVLHNGILIQNHSIVLGTTDHQDPPEYKAHGPAPIVLQDHGDPVRFRNIWIRAL